MQYAFDNNGTLKYPSAEEFQGVPNWPRHCSLLRAHGYMPLVGRAERRDGYIGVPKAWRTMGEGREAYIEVTEWEYVPLPPPEPEPPLVVRYSKYKIQLTCQKRGLWEQVKAAIANAGLADSWTNIVDIASDNEELQRALPGIRVAFGSDTVDEVLAESIAD